MRIETKTYTHTGDIDTHTLMCVIEILGNNKETCTNIYLQQR